MISSAPPSPITPRCCKTPRTRIRWPRRLCFRASSSRMEKAHCKRTLSTVCPSLALDSSCLRRGCAGHAAKRDRSGDNERSDRVSGGGGACSTGCQHSWSIYYPKLFKLHGLAQEFRSQTQWCSRARCSRCASWATSRRHALLAPGFDCPSHMACPCSQWNDPRIQSLNPALRLPAASFQVAILVPDANTLASGFSSGINSIFSAAMSHFSAEWNAACGSNPDSTTWPKPSNFIAYSTLDGLLSAMSQVLAGTVNCVHSALPCCSADEHSRVHVARSGQRARPASGVHGQPSWSGESQFDLLTCDLCRFPTRPLNQVLEQSRSR